MCASTFINKHAAAVHLLAQAQLLQGTAEQRLEQLARQFEQGCEYDAVDDSAAPVYVYTREGRAVAWYDWELAQGYRAV